MDRKKIEKQIVKLEEERSKSEAKSAELQGKINEAWASDNIDEARKLITESEKESEIRNGIDRRLAQLRDDLEDAKEEEKEAARQRRFEEKKKAADSTRGELEKRFSDFLKSYNRLLELQTDASISTNGGRLVYHVMKNRGLVNDERSQTARPLPENFAEQVKAEIDGAHMAYLRSVKEAIK